MTYILERKRTKSIKNIQKVWHDNDALCRGHKTEVIITTKMRVEDFGILLHVTTTDKHDLER